MLCALMIVYQNSKFSSILIQKVMMLLWVNGCWATATSRCFAFIYLLDGVRLVIKWRQVGFTASQLVQHPHIYHTITTATEKYRLNACTTVSLSYLVSFFLLVISSKLEFQFIMSNIHINKKTKFRNFWDNPYTFGNLFYLVHLVFKISFP